MTAPENAAPPREPSRRFSLLRYFTISGLVCTLITTGALGFIYRQHEIGEMNDQALRESQAFAQVMSFTMRPEISELLQAASDRRDVTAAIERIDRMVRAQGAYFNASKVKIYTPDGTTVYSTVQRELGELEDDNAGFLGAMAGRVVSSAVHRNEFNTFDHVMEDRDLLQTYLPLAGDQEGTVIGVFELYSDMTDLLARVRSTERLVLAGVGATLLLLFGVMFAFVYRADRIIRRQDCALRDQMREINRYNLELEDRVRARTGELEAANAKLRDEMRERILAERELELARQYASQQDKLAAIGRLAAGIVHEIGNPLAGLRGLVETAWDNLGAQRPQDVERALGMIRELVQRIESITRDVSGFSVSQSREPELVNLNELVSRVVSVLRYDEALNDLDLRMHLDRELPAISAVPDQIWLVLMNLVLNAAEAIHRKPGAERHIEVATLQREGGVAITVRDGGVGMDEAALSRVFEPFQTTKPPGAGLGIGLSLCYSAVRRHGGDIDIESRPGQGTTVKVTLPLGAAAMV